MWCDGTRSTIAGIFTQYYSVSSVLEDLSEEERDEMLFKGKFEQHMEACREKAAVIQSEGETVMEAGGRRG